VVASFAPRPAADFNLLSQLARETVYDDITGQHLFSALAEAARICGWRQFDAGLHAATQSYYITASHASATASDRDSGANLLAFMVIQSYSAGNPQDAVNLVRTAQAQAARAAPRVRSMLHARAGRALSKIGDRKGSSQLVSGQSPEEPRTAPAQSASNGS
jgi:hypothetical protein